MRVACLLLAATVAAGCSKPVADPSAVQKAEPAPRVVDSSQFADFDGMPVVVEGIFVQADLRKRKRGSDPVYSGHTAVQLQDEHLLYIEPTWSDAAIRPPNEIEAFEGQRVLVRGMLHDHPTPPEPMAAMISPCLTDVVEVQLVR